MLVFQVGVQRTRAPKIQTLEEKVDGALEIVKQASPEIAKATINLYKEDSLKTIFANARFTEQFKKAFESVGGNAGEWARLQQQYGQIAVEQRESQKLTMASLRGAVIRKATQTNQAYSDKAIEKAKEDNPFFQPPQTG